MWYIWHHNLWSYCRILESIAVTRRMRMEVVHLPFCPLSTACLLWCNLPGESRTGSTPNTLCSSLHSMLPNRLAIQTVLVLHRKCSFATTVSLKMYVSIGFRSYHEESSWLELALSTSYTCSALLSRPLTQPTSHQQGNFGPFPYTRVLVRGKTNTNSSKRMESSRKDE